MADLQDKIEQRRRILEKILGLVPGYSQYQQQEKRRDADKVNRDFLYQDLRKAQSLLGEITLRLTNQGHLDTLADIDRTGRKLRTVADRIRLADYGYAGFFDALKIQEEELDKMYQFDLDLAEQVKLISSKVEGLKDSQNAAQGLAELDKAIEDLDEQFDLREKTIMGVA